MDMGAEEGRGVQGDPQVPGLGTRLGSGSILRWGDKAEGTDVWRWMMMSSGVRGGHKKEGLEV